MICAHVHRRCCDGPAAETRLHGLHAKDCTGNKCSNKKWRINNFSPWNSLAKGTCRMSTRLLRQCEIALRRLASNIIYGDRCKHHFSRSRPPVQPLYRLSSKWYWQLPSIISEPYSGGSESEPVLERTRYIFVISNPRSFLFPPGVCFFCVLILTNDIYKCVKLDKYHTFNYCYLCIYDVIAMI